MDLRRCHVLDISVTHSTKRSKGVVSSLTIHSEDRRLDLRCEQLDKMLVRTTSRMGDSILATTAIPVFRRHFPDARLDFVGPAVSETLLQNLPINHHFTLTRHFPEASWAYLALLAQLRSIRYDLALDLSCSQSAMGSFIVGLSGGGFSRWLGRRLGSLVQRKDCAADGAK
jgi:hypothetical protein